MQLVISLYYTSSVNRESLALFESRIKPRVYVRRITRSCMYTVRKSSILLAGTGVRKISSVARGFSPIKIHFSEYLKSLISRINEVYVFFNKTRNGPAQARVMMKSVLSSAEHGRCPHNY